MCNASLPILNIFETYLGYFVYSYSVQCMYILHITYDAEKKVKYVLSVTESNPYITISFRVLAERPPPFSSVKFKLTQVLMKY